MFFALVGVITIFPILTFAESITNINGIVISEEEYNNFLKVHSHEYIMTMNDDKYQKLKSLDYSNVVTETKYIETTYNPSLNLITEQELTEEEYENYNTWTTYGLSDGGLSRESTAKRLVMAVLGGTTWNYVSLTATWKYVPTVRSYDVIGFRGYGLEFRDGSQIGNQIYAVDGEYTMIDYDWNIANTKRFDNGFGISMNIVNNTDIEFLQLIAECDVKMLESYPSLSGSYQHAVSSVSLANSQNYTLGGAGLGTVFVFPYSISQKYDGMSGLLMNFDDTL